MIVGVEQPTGGTLNVGLTVVTRYVGQSREAPDPTRTVIQEIAGGSVTR